MNFLYDLDYFNGYFIFTHLTQELFLYFCRYSFISINRDITLVHCRYDYQKQSLAEPLRPKRRKTRYFTQANTSIKVGDVDVSKGIKPSKCLIEVGVTSLRP